MSGRSDIQWLFESLGEFGGSTGQAWKDVLSGSEQSPAELLAREAIQNSGDAHDKSKTGSPVRIRISRRLFVGRELKTIADVLLTAELRKRIEAIGFGKLGLPAENTYSKLLKPDGKELEVTIIEDFNTVGLGGALANHHGSTQAGDHFQKLLFLLGGTDKASEATTGGSFGYGKSVYSALSDARTFACYSVFEPTKRSDDHYARFIASGLFDSHAFGNQNNTGRAYLAIPSNSGGPMPAVDDTAHRLAKQLGIPTRTQDQRGATVIIFGTRIGMDQLRAEIEKYWWPKLVDQELTVELNDGDKELPPPSPKANETLKPYLTCYEILARRQDPDTSKDQRRSRLNAVAGKQLGEWAALRVEETIKDADELEGTLLNRIALIRGAKMVVEYSDKFCLPGAAVAIVGAFVASPEIDNVLKLSEPPAHNRWDPKSQRPDESGQQIVLALLDRLRRQIRAFHRELLPAPPPSNAKLKLLEELLGRLLEADPGIQPPPPPTSDPFQLTHKVNRKEKNGRATIVGSVRIELRKDAEQKELGIEYVPKIEILEDEDRSAGDELPLVNLRVTEGRAKVEIKNNRKVVTGRLRKGAPIVVSFESDPTIRDWLLAYHDELRAV